MRRLQRIGNHDIQRDDAADHSQCSSLILKESRRAAWPGSMEAEVRHIFNEALSGEKLRLEPNLTQAIRQRLLPLGGTDEIELHPPKAVSEPPRDADGLTAVAETMFTGMVLEGFDALAIERAYRDGDRLRIEALHEDAEPMLAAPAEG